MCANLAHKLLVQVPKNNVTNSNKVNSELILISELLFYLLYFIILFILITILISEISDREKFQI